MSVAGSKYVPNDWTVRGACDLEGQADNEIRIKGELR